MTFIIIKCGNCNRNFHYDSPFPSEKEMTKIIENNETDEWIERNLNNLRAPKKCPYCGYPEDAEIIGLTTEQLLDKMRDSVNGQFDEV